MLGRDISNTFGLLGLSLYFRSKLLIFAPSFGKLVTFAVTSVHERALPLPVELESKTMTDKTLRSGEPPALASFILMSWPFGISQSLNCEDAPQGSPWANF